MTWIDKEDGDIIYASDINMIYHRGDEVLEQGMTAKNTAEQTSETLRADVDFLSAMTGVQL